MFKIIISCKEASLARIIAQHNEQYQVDFIEIDNFCADNLSADLLILDENLKFPTNLGAVVIQIGSSSQIKPPFHVTQILNKIDEIFAQKTALNNLIELKNGVKIDLVSKILTFEPKNLHINLTEIEVKLIEFLASTPAKCATRENLLQNVWNYNIDETKVVESAIYKLRKKIRDQAPDLEVILSSQEGYSLA